jgi:septum formation protein
MELILASASPRRQELLRYITTSFRVEPSGVEEKIPESMELTRVPEYLAGLKARDVAAHHPDETVIGCDTGVFIDGQMLGKPKDRADAKAMLSRLSGRRHQVITGCVILREDREESFSEVTEVEFYPLTAQQIEAYLDLGDYKDKAGSYGIQGAGALLVRGIVGDFYNVMGLPVGRLARALQK